MGSTFAPLFGRLTLEEIANTVTHGIGLLLSIAGFVVLLVFAILHGAASHMAALQLRLPCENISPSMTVV